MSIVHWLLLVALGIFVLLYARSPAQPRVAWGYLRWLTMISVSVLILAPFLWLIAAAFKDQTVLNEYVFFPPLSKWSHATLNLDNSVATGATICASVALAGQRLTTTR